MKRGTPALPKMRQLARSLGIPVPHAVGIMEMLWQLAAETTPAGDIGKHCDEDIAHELYWPEADAGRLISALLDSRWLDSSEEHRLLVHDWPEHCEDSIHIKLARAGKFFANGEVPKLQRLAAHERERIEALYASAQQAKKSAQCAHAVRTKSAPPLPLPKPMPLPVPMPSVPALVERTNGDSPPPPDVLPGDAFFERQYARHPKKGHRGSAQNACSQIPGIDSAEVQRRIDAQHAAWCATEAWRWKAGAKAPYLDEWYIDRGYDYAPPEDPGELDEISQILMGVKHVG